MQTADFLFFKNKFQNITFGFVIDNKKQKQRRTMQLIFLLKYAKILIDKLELKGEHKVTIPCIKQRINGTTQSPPHPRPPFQNETAVYICQFSLALINSMLYNGIINNMRGNGYEIYSCW